MCHFLSGWISLDARTIYPGDLVHHDKGAALHGISEKVASPWEWTEGCLSVVMSPVAKHKGATEAWYKQCLLDKFTDRDGAIRWCLGHLLPSVETLDLRGCTGLTSIQNLPNVEWLDLRGCTGLTSIQDLPSVKTLYMSGCTGLTSIQNLPNVEWLKLSGCTGLTSIQDLPSVETLDLGGCTGLTSIQDLPSVETLYMSGCTGLTSIQNLPSVKWLDMSGLSDEFITAARRRYPKAVVNQ